MTLADGGELLTRKELAARWRCGESALYDMEKEGTLPRVGSEYGRPPNPLYRLSDILRIENGDEASSLTAYERQRLEAENERLRAANKKLVGIIQNLNSNISVATAEAFKEVYG